MRPLPSSVELLLPESPELVIFPRCTPEAEAAYCNLAALCIHNGHVQDISDHKYLFSLGIAHPAPRTGYVHYFAAPDGGYVPVITTHTPGIDDLGGLIRPDA